MRLDSKGRALLAYSKLALIYALCFGIGNYALQYFSTGYGNRADQLALPLAMVFGLIYLFSITRILLRRRSETRPC